MAITLPHIEDSSLTHYIPPKGEYQTFRDEEQYEEMVRLWELSGAKTVKKEFWYKGKTYQRLVTIKGYETYGETDTYYTLVIEFQDGNLSCIHPAYLKEMQGSSFGKETNLTNVENKKETMETKNDKVKEVSSEKPKTEKAPKSEKPKKTKTPKLILPEDKVHFTAKVKQFAYSWNHFNEENDEVIVLEEVNITGENPLEIGLAWCSHSKTLKKFELSPGETIEFDGKIVKKSLPKGKDVEEDYILDVSISYKVNNPSKITKK